MAKDLSGSNTLLIEKLMDIFSHRRVAHNSMMWRVAVVAQVQSHNPKARTETQGYGPPVVQ
jgi:hypothetical protein